MLERRVGLATHLALTVVHDSLKFSFVLFTPHHRLQQPQTLERSSPNRPNVTCVVVVAARHTHARTRLRTHTVCNDGALQGFIHYTLSVGSVG